jgi:UDP-N-acetylglucosamine 2-epimerase (non-hydrolysing)
MSTICLVVGARPNFMKTAPVYRALERAVPETKLVLVHTGQHYDERMSQVFIGELGLPEPDVFLGVGPGRHGEQTARALVGVEQVLVEHEPDLLVVAGDVNSTLAAALAAVKLHVPVAHIESGLRSFDNRMPEEHNRRLTDILSSVLLAHCQDALDNLAHEGVDAGRVHLVGNTMIDSVVEHLSRALAAEPWNQFELPERGYALVTLHRPALVDDPALLEQTLSGLAALAEEMPVLCPVHPRTRARIAAALEEAPASLILSEPLGYLEFLGHEARARLVLTDSGGVQEETSVLGTPCFTLRDSTERPVTITSGTNTLLGARPDLISTIPALLSDVPETRTIPLWDGHAGPRAAQVLVDFLAA